MLTRGFTLSATSERGLSQMSTCQPKSSRHFQNNNKHLRHIKHRRPPQIRSSQSIQPYRNFIMSPQDRPPPYSETMADASEAKVQKLIVGVDFGTTFTGISWVSTEGAHSKTLDDVHCIRDW